MATTNVSASHPPGKPAPIPCTVLSGDALNGLLAVDGEGEGARVALDLQVRGERCVYLILEQDTAIDLALRLTGAVMRQRRAATA
jgi:hypothetical protein